MHREFSMVIVTAKALAPRLCIRSWQPAPIKRCRDNVPASADGQVGHLRMPVYVSSRLPVVWRDSACCQTSIMHDVTECACACMIMVVESEIQPMRHTRLPQGHTIDC